MQKTLVKAKNPSTAITASESSTASGKVGMFASSIGSTIL